MYLPKGVVASSLEEGSGNGRRSMPVADNIEMRPVATNATITRSSIGRVSSFSASSQRVPDTENRRSSLFGLGEGDDRLSQQNILDSWPMGLARPDNSVSTSLPVAYIRAAPEHITPVQNRDRLSLQRLQPSSSSGLGGDGSEGLGGLYREASGRTEGDRHSGGSGGRLSAGGLDRTDSSSRYKVDSEDGERRHSDEGNGRDSYGMRIDLSNGY